MAKSAEFLKNYSTKRIIVTSDLYRVDDRVQDLVAPPAAINTKWIYEILGVLAGNITSLPVVPLLEFAYPDPLSRVAVYRRLCREFSSAGWASIFDDINDSTLEDQIAARFENSLVIAYELPPYLLRILQRHDIPYIDFFLHPVRFLPDYMFGARSNVRSIYDRIVETSVPDALISEFTRISAGRTARMHRSKEPFAGSVVFFGQIGVDSSLISDGQLASIDDVENALCELSADHPNIYYKPHPHVENAEVLKARFSKISNLKWVDWNSYDILAMRQLASVSSLSSGTLTEARYFDMPSKRFLPSRRNIPDQDWTVEQSFEAQVYYPVPPAIFREGYLSYLIGLHETAPPLELPDPCEGALKFSLAMKWGR